METRAPGPFSRWSRRIIDDLWKDPPERHLQLHLRLVLVGVAFCVGLGVDLLSARAPRLAEVGPILRFFTLGLVSVFVSQWPAWLLLSMGLSVTWWVLAWRDVLRPLRSFFGLVVRNIGHFEAAFVCVVLATLRPWRMWFTLTLIVAILALGLYAAGAVGELYLELRPLLRALRARRLRATRASGRRPLLRRILLRIHWSPQPPNDAERLAARRWVVGLVTLLGSLRLFREAWPQWRTLAPLAGTYVVSVVLRLAALRWVRAHCGRSALRETSAVTVDWAKRFDLPFTAAALVFLASLRLGVIFDNASNDDDDRRARTTLAWGFDARAIPARPAAVSPPGVSLFIVSDSQFHELRGRRVGVHRDLVDDFVPVAIRPVELDLLSGVTFRHFGDVYRRLGSDRPNLLWTHLGDFADLGCSGEMDRAEKYLRVFAGVNGAQLAALVPGNHDSTFVGNFVWHPDWTEACRPAGDRTGSPFFVTKADTNRRLSNLMTAWLPAGSVHTINHGLDSPPTTALVSFRVLSDAGDKAGDPVVGAFLDTSDYTAGDSLFRLIGIAGEQGNISEEQADLVLATLRDVHSKARVILFMHHPYGSLSSPARKRLREVFAMLGERLLAVVSAHTHLAALRPLRSGRRTLPELVVGSILDPPQEAALLEVPAGGAVRLTTIPSVERAKAPAVGYPEMVTAGDCRKVLERIGAAPRCGPLLNLSCARPDEPTLDPDLQKRSQQVRAARLLQCLAIDTGHEPVPDDGSCPDGAANAEACPLDDPRLYEKLDKEIERLWAATDSRNELVCLARAAAILQGHKREGWGFAEALLFSVESAVDYHPLIVEGESHPGKFTAWNLPIP
jgi:hypothetical protein